MAKGGDSAESDEEVGRNELETGMSKKMAKGGDSAESDEEVGSNEGEQFETEKSQPEAEIKNDHHEEHDEELGEDAVGGRRNELETGMSKKMAKGGHSAESDEEVVSNEGEQLENEKSQTEPEINPESMMRHAEGGQNDKFGDPGYIKAVQAQRPPPSKVLVEGNIDVEEGFDDWAAGSHGKGKKSRTSETGHAAETSNEEHDEELGEDEEHDQELGEDAVGSRGKGKKSRTSETGHAAETSNEMHDEELGEDAVGSHGKGKKSRTSETGHAAQTSNEV